MKINWIKCKDQLPPYQEEVLLLNVKKEITVGYLEKGCGREYWTTGAVDGWEWDFEFANSLSDVTHWACLSEIELPEEGA